MEIIVYHNCSRKVLLRCFLVHRVVAYVVEQHYTYALMFPDHIVCDKLILGGKMVRYLFVITYGPCIEDLLLRVEIKPYIQKDFYKL